MGFEIPGAFVLDRDCDFAGIIDSDSIDSLKIESQKCFY